MSRFFRAGLAAALVAFVVAFAPSPVLADANPNNHGHHYGQLKHRQPPPVPNPPPSSTTTGVSPANASHRGGVPSAVQQGTSALPQLTIDVPLPVFRTDGVKTVPPIPSGDESWLLLLILPALLAVWALVFTRAALAAARLRRAQPGQPAASS